MRAMADDGEFSFEISLSVLNHLGRNLYRNFITVLGEAISNSWDADAKNVCITIDRPNGRFVIKDNGAGMSAEDFQKKFLKIGYSKRKEGVTETSNGRPYIGAKGIGKLALLSCAKRISIFTKTATGEYTGGVIDNGGLDEAIKDDLTPSQYALEQLDFGLIEGLADNHDSGTIIVFEGASDILTNSEEQIRKLLAMSFRFSLYDAEFAISVNGVPVSIDDLKALAEATEFIWVINDYEDEFTKSLSKLKREPQKLPTDLQLRGFIATVEFPKDLKIKGTEERATVDLFANGRLREKNVLRHIPTQRVAESYMYGLLQYDVLDQKGDDPFTSSREGIVHGDPDFQRLLDYLSGPVRRQIIEDEWDKFRRERGEDGDEDNPAVSKKNRRAASLYAISVGEFKPEGSGDEAKQVARWLNELRPDAIFNLASYSDCFLAENLVRKFINHEGVKISPDFSEKAKGYRISEETAKAKANVSFDIRTDTGDVSYFGMSHLAEIAEGGKPSKQVQSLYTDSLRYKPARDAVGHTALLTDLAKNDLNVTFGNIRGRVKSLLENLTKAKAPAAKK